MAYKYQKAYTDKPDEWQDATRLDAIKAFAEFRNPIGLLEELDAGHTVKLVWAMYRKVTA